MVRHVVRVLAVTTMLLIGTTSVVSAASPPKSPLLVGVISSDQSPVIGGYSSDVPKALSIWQRFVNSKGGVNGHPVKVIEKNDSDDPAKALAAAQGLIQSDHVVAIVDNSLVDPAWFQYPASQQVPVLCMNPSYNGFKCSSNPNMFPTGSTVLAIVYSSPFAAKLQGAKTFGTFYCAEQAACAQALPLVHSYTKQVGMAVGADAALTPAAPNYTAQCLAAKAAGDDAIFLAGVTAQTVADNCGSQGYHPIYVNQSTLTLKQERDPNFNNEIHGAGFFPYFVRNKATAQFHTVFDGFIKTALLPRYAAAIWTTMGVFAKAAAHVSDTPSAQDIYQGLYAIHDETLGGLTGPLTYVQGKPTTVSCFFIQGIKNGHDVAPYGLKRYCQPTS